ncbi:MAG: insulinase family protein [Candidatus Heimdallarchaeota archaeon]|nr:insulinase family protein [Candidatus Heimdallarchaeota archaeon]
MQGCIIKSFPNLRTCTLGIVNYHGSAHDTVPGSTQVLLQTLTRGSKNYSEQEIANIIDGTGGSLFSATEKTFSFLGARIQPKFVLKSLDLLIDILTSPNLDPENIEIEKQNLIQVYDQINAHPLRKMLLMEADKAIFGPDHPFGRMVIGNPESLGKIDAQIMKETHSKLIVEPWGLAVGNFPREFRDELIKAFEENFLCLEKKKTEKLKIPSPKLTKNHIITSPINPNGNVYLCLNLTTDVTKKSISLARFSSSVLGESFGSRMFSELREKRGLGYLVGSSLNLVDKFLTIRCYLETSPNRVIEALEALLKIIFDLGLNKIPIKEFRTTRDFILGNLDLSFDNSQMIMSRILNRQIYGLSPNLDESYREIKDVTPKGILDWWKTFRDNGNLSCAVVGNFDENELIGKWESLLNDL